MSAASKNSAKIYRMVVAGLLCAIGIMIPMISPLKIVLEPASFTLASHVPVMLAMFISPVVAAFVALGTTVGFFMGGFPLVVVIRAFSHIVFCIVGAFYIKKRPDTINSFGKYIPFSLLIGVLHGICEVIVVMPFYFSQSLTEGYYSKGFFISVLLLVGVGTLVHSMIDSIISLAVWTPIKKTFKKPVGAM